MAHEETTEKPLQVHVGILATAEPIQEQLKLAEKALQEAHTLLDCSLLKVADLDNLDVAVEELGQKLAELSSDIGTAISKAS